MIICHSEHLLSLTTGIAQADIKKVEIQNTGGGFLPAYDPVKGGGAITFPEEDGTSYRMNLTNNFFENTNNKYGNNGFQNDIMEWLDLTSHEVGHIRDIKEIGGSKVHYFSSFIKEYIQAGSHDGSSREKRADVGRNQFRSFVRFVDSYYGKDKIKKLFENTNNSDKDKSSRIDQWWKQFERQKEVSKKSSNEKK